jgi:hypothetical protein
MNRSVDEGLLSWPISTRWGGKPPKSRIQAVLLGDALDRIVYLYRDIADVWDAVNMQLEALAAPHVRKAGWKQKSF